MSFRALLVLAPLVLSLTGCAQNLPDAQSVRLAAEASSKSGVVIYWPCLIDLPGAGSAAVHIDGKKAGDIAPCHFERFAASPGPHKIRIVEAFTLDFGGAFGWEGPSYDVPDGRPLYIRLFRFQYLEHKVVSDEVGRRDVAGLSRQ